MQIRCSANGHEVNRVEILAPAKINLFFEVLHRRDDGFHEIETLMVPLRWFDTLVLEDDPTGRVTLEASWAAGFETQPNAGATVRPAADDNLNPLPEGDDNLVVRAIRLLAQRAGVHRGAKLRLVKRIPMAAGLGGGSSDAAATLVAANHVWNLGWSRQRLVAVAAELGSDVPFFLADGPAICRGRGEKVQPVAGPRNLHCVVVCPPEGLPTAAVYRACRSGNPPQSVKPAVEAFVRGNLSALGPVVHNRLLPAARGLSPWVDRLLERLTAINCPAIGMSGSGASCFAVCRNALQARQMARRLHGESLGHVRTVSSI